MEKGKSHQRILLREQFCKEYYSKNKNYLPEEQKGIDLILYYKEYSIWLEENLILKTIKSEDY